MQDEVVVEKVLRRGRRGVPGHGLTASADKIRPIPG
jgi:hypothetical protein